MERNIQRPPPLTGHDRFPGLSVQRPPDRLEYHYSVVELCERRGELARAADHKDTQVPFIEVFRLCLLYSTTNHSAMGNHGRREHDIRAAQKCASGSGSSNLSQVNRSIHLSLRNISLDPQSRVLIRSTWVHLAGGPRAFVSSFGHLIGRGSTPRL